MRHLHYRPAVVVALLLLPSLALGAIFYADQGLVTLERTSSILPRLDAARLLWWSGNDDMGPTY